MTINGIVKGLDTTGSSLDGWHRNKGRLKSVRLVETVQIEMNTTEISKAGFSMKLAMYHVGTEY